MLRILVTDGEGKNALAAVRSLGKKGFTVDAISYNRFAVTRYSKYCNKFIICPKLSTNKEFAEFLINLLEHERYDVLVPIGLQTCEIVSAYKKELEKYTKFAIADYEEMMICLEKSKTLKLAEKLKIPTPKTYFLEDIKDLSNLSNHLEYPVVIKAPYGGGSKLVDYANNKAQLHKRFKEITRKDERLIKNPPFIQELITGYGAGFFALYDRGKCKAVFMHKRIRELPVTGGASTCAQSIYNEKLKRYGCKILDSLKWHGVAMVEFKHDERIDDFVLIEVNPKFWGSLDLSIASGVDFPFLLVKLALGEEISYLGDYSKGLKFSWLPYEIVHVILKPSSFRGFLRDFVDKNTKTNFWKDDIMPFIMDIPSHISRFRNK